MEQIKAFFAKYPPFGLRTVKTVLSVIISSVFVKYVLGHNPFFACIGAVVAMEKTLSLSIRAAIIRNVGTIIGGLIGIAISTFTHNTILMALGLIPFIWVSNLIGKQESIVPGAIVYFAVFWLNTSEQAWAYGLTRILGTLIGSLISIAINACVFPQKSQAEAPNGPATPTKP